jgi:hypothetical protein
MSTRTGCLTLSEDRAAAHIHGICLKKGPPHAAWARYALDAELMLVRDPASADWTAPAGVTFRDWLRGSTGTLPRTTFLRQSSD